MNFRKIAFALSMAGTFLCSAEVYDLSKIESWKTPNPLIQQSSNTLRAKGRLTVFSKEIYPYDAKKTYTFKGLYRQLPGGSTNNYFRIGILPLDENKKTIQYYASHPNVSTNTVLAKAVVATDDFIIVENGSKWNKSGLTAYNTKPDQSDLPNNNIIKQVPKSIEQTADGWKISFAKPVGVAIPAGTGVRQHYQGGWFRFAGNVSEGKVVSNMKLTGVDVGTKYIQVVIVSGVGVKPDEPTPVIEMRKPALEVSE